MTSYSLVEYSLRQYFYLGHKCLMYDPVFLRTSSCRVNGIKIIGKIVKKNILEGINTIVSIILKVVIVLSTIFNLCDLLNLLLIVLALYYRYFVDSNLHILPMFTK